MLTFHRIIIDKKMEYAVLAGSTEEASANAMVAARGGLAGILARRTKLVKIETSVHWAQEVGLDEYEKLLDQVADRVRREKTEDQDGTGS